MSSSSHSEHHRSKSSRHRSSSSNKSSSSHRRSSSSNYSMTIDNNRKESSKSSHRSRSSHSCPSSYSYRLIRQSSLYSITSRKSFNSHSSYSLNGKRKREEEVRLKEGSDNSKEEEKKDMKKRSKKRLAKEKSESEERVHTRTNINIDGRRPNQQSCAVNKEDKNTPKVYCIEIKQPLLSEKEVLINGINLILKEMGIKSKKYKIIQNILNSTHTLKISYGAYEKNKILIEQLEEFLQQLAGYSTIKPHEKDLFEFALKNTDIF